MIQKKNTIHNVICTQHFFFKKNKNKKREIMQARPHLSNSSVRETDTVRYRDISGSGVAENVVQSSVSHYRGTPHTMDFEEERHRVGKSFQRRWDVVGNKAV